MNGTSSAHSVSATTSLPNNALPEGSGNGRSIGAPARSASEVALSAIPRILVPVRRIALQHELADAQRGVFRRIAGSGATRQAGDLRIEVGYGEEGDRVAFGAGAVDHPMRRGGEAVVGPTRHHVADVDHEAAGDRR